MGKANDMQKLVDAILSSYEVRANELQQRLKDNNAMVKDVHEMIDGFRNDHQEIAARIKANAKKLKADMGENENDRMISFKEMMDGIKGTISKIQDEVVRIKNSTENMMKDFTADKEERASWNTDRLKSFDDMMQGIHDDMTRIRKEVTGIFDETDKMLKNFDKEHSDMSAELKADLQANLEKRRDDTRALLNEISKENQQMAKKLHAELNKSRKDLAASDVQRLKDFKVTMGAIQSKVHEIQTFVNTFLGDLKIDRIQSSEIWEKLAEAKASLGKMAKAEPAAKKEVVAGKKPVAPVKAKPAPEKEKANKAEPAKKEPELKEKPLPEPKKPKKEADTEEKELSLEEKVLEYINKHPKGVRVSDMEKPLGETRMKIGYIAKQLLNQGKVRKINNLYFPKTVKLNL